MGLFNGIDKTRPNMGGNYARSGNYLALIRRVKQDTTRRGVEFIAIEMVNLKTVAPGTGEEPHRVGEAFSHLIMSDKESFLGNVKAFIMGVSGLDDSEVGETECIEVVSDKQPFSGLIVELNNRVIQTKKGTPFTLVNFVRTLSPAEVKATIDVEALKGSLSESEQARYLS